MSNEPELSYSDTGYECEEDSKNSLMEEKNAVQYYYERIKNNKILSQEEIIQLFTEYREGNFSARNKIIESNLRLVVKYALEYFGSSLSEMDLIQEGNIGLIKAVEKYDPSKGINFSTYAIFWIRQAISHALKDKDDMVRKPVRRIEEEKETNTIIEDYMRNYGRNPSTGEISEILGISKRKARNIINNKIVITLDEPVGESGGNSILDFVSDESINVEEIVTDNFIRPVINEILGKYLSERERTVLEMRYGLGGKEKKTLREIADAVNLSKERVRQIECKALCKLKTKKEVKNLKDYLSVS